MKKGTALIISVIAGVMIMLGCNHNSVGGAGYGRLIITLSGSQNSRAAAVPQNLPDFTTNKTIIARSTDGTELVAYGGSISLPFGTYEISFSADSPLGFFKTAPATVNVNSAENIVSLKIAEIHPHFFSEGVAYSLRSIKSNTPEEIFANEEAKRGYTLNTHIAYDKYAQFYISELGKQRAYLHGSPLGTPITFESSPTEPYMMMPLTVKKNGATDAVYFINVNASNTIELYRLPLHSTEAKKVSITNSSKLQPTSTSSWQVYAGVAAGDNDDTLYVLTAGQESGTWKYKIAEIRVATTGGAVTGTVSTQPAPLLLQAGGSGPTVPTDRFFAGGAIAKENNVLYLFQPDGREEYVYYPIRIKNNEFKQENRKNIDLKKLSLLNVNTYGVKFQNNVDGTAYLLLYGNSGNEGAPDLTTTNYVLSVTLADNTVKAAKLPGTLSGKGAVQLNLESSSASKYPGVSVGFPKFGGGNAQKKELKKSTGYLPFRFTKGDQHPYSIILVPNARYQRFTAAHVSWFDTYILEAKVVDHTVASDVTQAAATIKEKKPNILIWIDSPAGSTPPVKKLAAIRSDEDDSATLMAKEIPNIAPKTDSSSGEVVDFPCIRDKNGALYLLRKKTGSTSTLTVEKYPANYDSAPPETATISPWKADNLVLFDTAAETKENFTLSYLEKESTSSITYKVKSKTGTGTTTTPAELTDFESKAFASGQNVTDKKILAGLIKDSMLYIATTFKNGSTKTLKITKWQKDAESTPYTQKQAATLTEEALASASEACFVTVDGGMYIFPKKTFPASDTAYTYALVEPNSSGITIQKKTITVNNIKPNSSLCFFQSQKDRAFFRVDGGDNNLVTIEPASNTVRKQEVILQK